MVIEMGKIVSDCVTSEPATPEREGEYFENCKLCGQLMMTLNYQNHLVTACPEWGARTADDVRRILMSVGVRSLYEVSPGYCDYCSPRHFREHLGTGAIFG